MSSSPRLPGLPPEDWSPDVRALLGDASQQTSELASRVSPTLEDGEGPGPQGPLPILSVIAHRPSLLGPFLSWSKALSLDAVLDRREAELLALRAAHNGASPFEWEQHAAYARGAGLTREEIERVREGPEAPGWDRRAALLLTAADELGASTGVSAPTWAELEQVYEPAALVEIVLVVGQYTMLSMLANSVGLGGTVPTAAPDAGDPADTPGTGR